MYCMNILYDLYLQTLVKIPVVTECLDVASGRMNVMWQNTRHAEQLTADWNSHGDTLKSMIVQGEKSADCCFSVVTW